jgi:hypothetical protein
VVTGPLVLTPTQRHTEATTRRQIKTWRSAHYTMHSGVHQRPMVGGDGDQLVQQPAPPDEGSETPPKEGGTGQQSHWNTAPRRPASTHNHNHILTKTDKVHILGEGRPGTRDGPAAHTSGEESARSTRPGWRVGRGGGA